MDITEYHFKVIDVVDVDVLVPHSLLTFTFNRGIIVNKNTAA